MVVYWYFVVKNLHDKPLGVVWLMYQQTINILREIVRIVMNISIKGYNTIIINGLLQMSCKTTLNTVFVTILLELQVWFR